MLNKECRDYIGAGAFDKLQELWNTKQLKYFNGTQFSSSEPPDTVAATRGGRWSNSLMRGGPYSWDRTDRIVLGYLFFQPSVGGFTHDFDLSTESAMAFVLLHELKHVLSQAGHLTLILATILIRQKSGTKIFTTNVSRTNRKVLRG
jgi:hypothetical protein